MTSQNSVSSCIACAAGKMGRDSVGQTSSFSCEDCPLGRWSNKTAFVGSYCTPCGPGRYNEFTGQSSKDYCLPCAAGKRSKVDGVAATSSDACQDCERGTWSDAVAFLGQNCTSCSKGRYNELPGQTSVDKCLPCAAGKRGIILAAPSSSYCEDCEKGKYNSQSAYSGTECNLCPHGSYSDYKGAHICDECPLGR